MDAGSDLFLGASAVAVLVLLDADLVGVDPEAASWGRSRSLRFGSGNPGMPARPTTWSQSGSAGGPNDQIGEARNPAKAHSRKERQLRGDAVLVEQARYVITAN
jgi:hypothetical protein